MQRDLREYYKRERKYKNILKNRKFHIFYENYIFQGSFDNFREFLRKFAKVRRKCTLSLSISPNKFSEMEKTESFSFFKTFFLISKMDKNKCPIFILKKKFQKMKSPFFLTFFSGLKNRNYYGKW